MYLQCKLALQVQSKHIKILKKIKNKNKQTNKNKAQTNGHTWREKKKVHITNWINQKNTINESLAFFIWLIDMPAYINIKKKKTLGTVAINVKMLWT